MGLILVIEDNTAISENLAQVLTFEGFTLLTASSSLDALAQQAATEQWT